MSKLTDKREEKRSDESGTSGSSGGASYLTAATSPRDFADVISEEEYRFYYYGLTKSIHSTPRLIARSGIDRFSVDFETVGGWNMPKEAMKKRMSIVKPRSHLITSIYDGRIRARILEIIKEIDWKCVDIARVGRHACQDDNKVFVLITCPKDAKVDYSTGMRLVQQCQDILNE